MQFQRGKGRRTWAGGEFIPILAFGEEQPPVLPEKGENGWTRQSRRTGLLFKKMEMTTIFDQWGKMRAVTALKVSARACVCVCMRVRDCMSVCAYVHTCAHVVFCVCVCVVFAHVCKRLHKRSLATI